MMKNLKLSLVALLCLGYALTANAQKTIKEGAVTYSLVYDLPPEQQAMAAMLPTEFKINFKGDFSAFKLDLGMFSTQSVDNTATKESLNLIEVPMQNKKIAVKLNAEQSKKMQEMESGEKDYEVKATTEIKKIAGYNCTKYILNDKISGNSSEIWATNDINLPINRFSAAFKNVQGVPVEFDANLQGMKTKMTLKEVKEEMVADMNLTVPTGFETMSFEDLMKQMGG